MPKRTVLRFTCDRDFWPIIENWSNEREYREKARGDNWRQYRQGHGWLVAPKVVEIRQDGVNVEIQGWINPHWTARLPMLFLMPAELDLGKGFMANIPRSTARRDVNILLQMLGQPPINIKQR